MILMYGCDWAEWSYYETSWVPVFLSDKELSLVIESTKELIWPHKDAIYVVFGLNSIIAGNQVGYGSFNSRSEDVKKNKYTSYKKDGELLFEKQKPYRDGSSFLSLDAELRVFEDLSFVICLKVNLPKSSKTPDHSFVEFAYDEANQRWESLMKHNADYPHDIVDQIETEISNREGFEYANQ